MWPSLARSNAIVVGCFVSLPTDPAARRRSALAVLPLDRDTNMADDVAESSTAAGGWQQLPARLPDEMLRETGPDDPQLQVISELSQEQDAALVQ